MLDNGVWIRFVLRGYFYKDNKDTNAWLLSFFMWIYTDYMRICNWFSNAYMRPFKKSHSHGAYICICTSFCFYSFVKLLLTYVSVTIHISTYFLDPGRTDGFFCNFWLFKKLDRSDEPIDVWHSIKDPNDVTNWWLC